MTMGPMTCVAAAVWAVYLAQATDSATAGTGIPPDVENAIAYLSSDHAGRVRARTLVLPQGHPLLTTDLADRVRALLEREATGNAHRQGSELEQVVEQVFLEGDEDWPGAGHREYHARVASTRMGRLSQWTNDGGGSSAAVLKVEGVDLMYMGDVPAVGPQLVALAPSVAHIVPDLLHALRPLPLTTFTVDSLRMHEWRRADMEGAGIASWRAVHPSAPHTVLGIELERDNGLPVAVSLTIKGDGDASDPDCRMLSLIRHGPLADSPEQIWIRSVQTLVYTKGSLTVDEFTFDAVEFSPDAEDLALQVPADAHLYDERDGGHAFYGSRTPWPQALETLVRRDSTPAEFTRPDIGSRQAGHSPHDAQSSPRVWGRFLAAMTFAFGVLMTFAPSRSAGAGRSSLRRLAGVALGSYGLLLWGGTSGPANAAPHGEAIAHEEILPRHDFGRLVGAVERSVELHLRNDTAVTWTLRRTWNECGCVKLASASESVAPGEDASLVLRIDAEDQPAGPLQKRAFALYDPGPRRVSLTATAVLAPRPHPVPYLLDVELDPDQVEWFAEGAIESPFGGARAVLETSTKGVRVEMAEAEPISTGTRVSFICTGNLPADSLRGEFELEFLSFGDPELPDGERVVLRGTARRLPRLTVSPGCLVLADALERLHGRVWLRRADGTWPESVEVESTPEGVLSATYDPFDGGLHVEITNRNAGREDCRLRIRLPSGESVEMPVRVASVDGAE